MAEVAVSRDNSTQKFITNESTVLTNTSGTTVTVRLSQYTRDNLHTIADTESFTIPPGFLVETVVTADGDPTIGDNSYTDTDFSDETNVLNAENKYAGKMVWDSVNETPVWAVGPDADSLWVDATGATVWTPVDPATLVPEAFIITDWSLADATTGGTLTVTVSALPEDNNFTITDIEYRVDGGTAVSFESAALDDYDITGLTDDVEVDIEIRAINFFGASDWSDVKSETPTTA